MRTAHGVVPTPVFLPVGTQATVKTLTPEEIRGLGFKMLLSNTYHLYLRPGIDLIQRMGGLHRFMAWNGAILTDSGGYQIFSLARLCRVSDEGVAFRSHIDGSEHFLTPELAVACQQVLGSDVMMVLDECPAYGVSEAVMKEAVSRTHRWAERCLSTHTRPEQALYAIVQGGVYPALRQESAEYLSGLDFSGYAIGGLSVGEPKELTWRMVSETVKRLPPGKPRYLMGVGSPEDIVAAVARGIDILDSALPTRVARNGALFTREGRRNIRNAAFRTREEPISPGCGCDTCRSFSAAYLHHLFRSEELLAYRLATIHNLYFIGDLMRGLREAVLGGTLDAFCAEFLAAYQPADEETRFNQKQKWLRSRNKD